MIQQVIIAERVYINNIPNIRFMSKVNVNLVKPNNESFDLKD